MAVLRLRSCEPKYAFRSHCLLLVETSPAGSTVQIFILFFLDKSDCIDRIDHSQNGGKQHSIKWMPAFHPAPIRRFVKCVKSNNNKQPLVMDEET